MNEHIDGPNWGLSMPDPEDAYWDGYHRGLRETCDTWAACVYDVMDKRGAWHDEPTADTVNRILEQVERELGFRGKPGTPSV